MICDGSLRLWDLENGQTLRIAPGFNPCSRLITVLVSSFHF
jgi:hypothetical protein